MMPILAAINLIGNALLLWLGYYWLGIGESRTGTLLWSATVAAALLCLTCWLHGATFAYFAAPPKSTLRPVFRTALRNLLPLLLAAIAAFVLYAALSRWADYSGQPAFRFASYLTLKFRKPVRPSTILLIFNAALWLVRWMLVPLLLLPLIPAIASRGWRGFTALGRHARARYHWLQVPLLLVCALWFPFQIMAYVPRPTSFVLQMFSFVLRLTLAYLLFLSAWLLLAFATSGGRPFRSQPKTVVSP
jgi:hypothetical protein